MKLVEATPAAKCTHFSGVVRLGPSTLCIHIEIPSWLYLSRYYDATGNSCKNQVVLEK